MGHERQVGGLLEGPRPVSRCREQGCAQKGGGDSALGCLLAKHLLPELLLMMSAHLRLAGALDYLSWI